ncbi:MAG: hypothetical protein HOO93_12945 [Methyloglobulus sp.]|nr:hypothetical protein [Methyloglobulus sp.]
MGKYVFNAYCIDTTPGNPLSPFSPASDWLGNDDAYLGWLWKQFQANPAVRQRLAIAARARDRGDIITVTGHYGKPLLDEIAKFGKTKTESQ